MTFNIPSEIWVVALNEVTEFLSDHLNVFDAVKCLTCTLQTGFSLCRDRGDCGAKAMYRGKGGVVFELYTFPVEKYIEMSVK